MLVRNDSFLASMAMLLSSKSDQKCALEQEGDHAMSNSHDSCTSNGFTRTSSAAALAPAYRLRHTYITLRTVRTTVIAY